MNKKLLKECAYYVTEKISVSILSSRNYIGVDNMLPNKAGVTFSEFVPTSGDVTAFKIGDILIGNIRPYFKKIWLATFNGGCSPDVLCIRCNSNMYSEYLFSVLSQDAFFDYDMAGSKGSKMPRGDKNHIMNYPVPINDNMEKIGGFITSINAKISTNNRINTELKAMAKTIYDYWFTQFDFPNENGKPYRSSGGKMVWNKQLKCYIPKGWQVANLYSIGDYVNGLACQKYRPKDNFHKIPVIKITEMHNGIADNTEFVRDDVSDKYIINDGDILFSWSATLETMIWYGGKGGLNQHIFKVVPKCPKYYVYAQLSNYIINFKIIAEARKTTMGHITTEHIEQSKIANPPLFIQEKFNNKVSSIYDKIAINCKQNLILSNLRDWLLPMLMNGQVGFKEEQEEKLQIKVSGFEQWLTNQGFAARGDVDMEVLRNIYEAMDSDDK